MSGREFSPRARVKELKKYIADAKDSGYDEKIILRLTNELNELEKEIKQEKESSVKIKQIFSITSSSEIIITKKLESSEDSEFVEEDGKMYVECTKCKRPYREDPTKSAKDRLCLVCKAEVDEELEVEQ